MSDCYTAEDRKARPFAHWGLKKPFPRRPLLQVFSKPPLRPLLPQRLPGPLTALPPPTILPGKRPPLVLPRGGNDLVEAKMEDVVVGRWDPHKRIYYYEWEKLASQPFDKRNEMEEQAHGNWGIWTAGISDCMVVCAAYYSEGAWQQFWFQHVKGGEYTGILEAIKTELDDCPNKDARWLPPATTRVSTQS